MNDFAMYCLIFSFVTWLVIYLEIFVDDNLCDFYDSKTRVFTASLTPLVNLYLFAAFGYSLVRTVYDKVKEAK